MYRQDHYKPKKRRGLRKGVFKVVWSAYLVALVFRLFLVEGFTLPSDVMQPGLKYDDSILVNKFSYGIRLPLFNSLKLFSIASPQRGSLVAFYHPWYEIPGGLGQLLDTLTFSIFGFSSDTPVCFSRVVALPGDTLHITGAGELIVNGVMIARKQVVVKQSRKTSKIRFKEGSWLIEQQSPVQLRSSNGFFLRPFPQKGQSRQFYQDFADRFFVKNVATFASCKKITLLAYEEWQRGSRASGAMLVYNQQGEIWYRLGKSGKLQRVVVLQNGRLSLKLPKACYFVLNDSRDNGNDSRGFGFVSEKHIIGAPLFRYSPLSRLGTVD